MNLGVDLGTTRTIVATADRGNYPVVTFYDPDGEAHEHVPSVVALDGERLVHGHEAVAFSREGATLTRSFKRLLASADVTAETPVAVGDRQIPLLQLLTSYLIALRTQLVEQSSLSEQLTAETELRVAVGVPAHAHGTQRFLTLEVQGRDVSLPVAEFYEAAAPLVQQTVDCMAPLVETMDADALAGIYLVGGASALPLVPRVLRERFGRRVHRSPMPAASTAIGLAIATDESAGYSLRDRLSRGFGVFRELRGGAALSFDPIYHREDVLDPTQAQAVTRRYRAAHNLGCFRYVEHTGLSEHGDPTGDLVPFAEVTFPYDAALRDGRDLRSVPVQRRDHGPLVEERYVLDEHGIVEVRMTDLETGYSQTYALGTDA